MRVVGRHLIEDFCASHPEASGRFSVWLLEAGRAQWKTPQELKAQYGTASILAGNRAVFNIGGNRFRLLVGISYKNQIVSIKRVGTHADYDEWEL